MSTDTIKAPVVDKEALFSAKVKKAFKDPLLDQNPVTIQILGICSSLAVTTQVKPALIMGIGLTVVTAFSNVVISMMRNAIPNKIRIIIELAVVATMVILVDQLLQAFAFDLSRKLSVFVWLNNYQLYCYGPPRSVCLRKQTMAVFC